MTSFLQYVSYFLQKNSPTGTMHWKSAALSLALAAQDVAAAPGSGLMGRQFAQAAMMRFQCSQLVFDRIDPLVQVSKDADIYIFLFDFITNFTAAGNDTIRSSASGMLSHSVHWS